MLTVFFSLKVFVSHVLLLWLIFFCNLLVLPHVLLKELSTTPKWVYMVLVGDMRDHEIDEGQVTDHEIHLMKEQNLNSLLVLEMLLLQHDSTMLVGKSTNLPNIFLKHAFTFLK